MRARFDIWQAYREKAVMEDGLLILRDNTCKPTVKIWWGKQSKPYAYYSFRSIEHREKFIADQKVNFATHLKFKEEQKAAKHPTADQLASVKQGDIFSSSWGYDQTNVEFFQVVEKKGFFVIVRELAQDVVDGSEGFMCEHVIPIPAKYTSEPMRKRLSFCGDHVSIKIGHQSASPWDGSPKYASHYA